VVLTPGTNARNLRQESGGGLSRPRLVDRDDLLSALDRAAAGRVTIIAAPAGSGKTSLLLAWAERQDESCRPLIVHVDRDLQDAQLFWLALLRAVRELSGAPTSQEPPTATPEFSGVAMVDRVLTELAELADHEDRVILVIDDVHELTSPDALAHLTRLLTGLPSGVHAILATRRDLPLHLHQLRLAGELAELRAADLRFTEQETRELLAASGITLSDTAVALLHERTEGWAAGLRLAAISLTGHPDPERFVAEFTGSSRTVAEYLIAEMLERQPEDVQNLLLRTSVLQRVNGELADLLTGRAGSERILLDLEDANAFVVSLDPERTWFRYHRLFADLLRLELRRTLPDERQALHRRAADWLAQHGQLVEAVQHRQAAGDWPEAAALLADHSFGMMLNGQEETMQALLQAFPRRPGVEYPELSVVRTMVDLVHGRLDEAAAHLAVTDAHLESTSPDRRRRLRATIASLRLWLARRRGSLADVLEFAECLSGPSGGQSDEDIALGNDLRVVALMNLGTVEAWSLGLSDGERHLREGAELARKIDRPYLEVACLAQLGFASKLTSFSYSRDRCEEAIALAEEHGWGTASILAPALVTLACSMVWMGEFDGADRRLQRAEQALQADSGPGIRTLLHLVNGMLRTGRDQQREALDEFAAAQELQSRLADPHALTGYVIGWTLATRARLGSSADARAELDGLDGPLADSGEVRNARAAICLTEGDPAGAVTAVAPVIDGSATAVFVATVVEAQLLSALAHHELGHPRAANEALEHALALAEPERLVLPFVMTGAGDLLAALPRHESAHAALLTDILDVVHGSSLAGRVRPLPPAQDLSPTELRVLRYLPTNLSRAEVAGELSISLNTVNTHVRNIYAKLQATNRSSAVQRARELRLLATGPSR
jgi:LuxR family transcriptional regulator, maltose regulon positive regulatory protein